MNNSYLFPIPPISGLFRTICCGTVNPVALTLVAILFVSGCDLPDRPKLKSVDQVRSFTAGNTAGGNGTEELESPTVLDQPFWETWDAYYSNNEQIGYSHVKASHPVLAMAADVHFALDHRVYQSSGKSRILQRLVLNSNETSDGRLVGFEGSMQVGLGVTRFAGVREGKNLIVEIRDGRNAERRTIPWEFNFRGMFAIEQSLRANPMRKIGQTRAIKMLISGRYELATARLRYSGRAMVPMLSESERELNEINVEIEVEGGQPIYSAIWTDDQGNVMRSYSPALNIISYRTDEATATGISRDDLVPLSVEVDGNIDQPRETKRVAYVVVPIATEDGESTVKIQPAPGQFIRLADDGGVQVLVSRRQETPSSGFVTDQPEPTSEDMRPNHFVDSKSETISKFSAVGIGDKKKTKLEVAQELTATAKRLVRPKLERCGLAKASEVARYGEGDCTQSALLLAALFRAQEIPSRIAIGLRFAPKSKEPPLPQRMVAHVWTIAYINDRWVHFDATEGNLAAADRLVFSTTNLSEENENEPFRTLIRDIDQIKIKVLAAKY